jgi:hypothetical protein
MTNAYRNELTVDLNGVECRLRPTFEAIAQIEEYCKRSIFQLAIEVQQNKWPSLTECHHILETTYKASGEKPNSDFKRNLVESGLTHTYKAVALLLNSALNAGDTAKTN